LDRYVETMDMLM